MKNIDLKKGSALMWVIGVSLFMGLGLMAIYSYIPKIAKLRTDSLKSLNTEIALNGVIDYTLNAIKGHWCMNDKWEAEAVCDFSKVYYFRRLMFEKDNGSLQSPLKQFQNILIATDDPNKSIPLEVASGDCLQSGLRCTKMIYERNLSDIENDNSTLKELLSPMLVGAKKIADKVRIEVDVQDVDDSDDTDSFRMKRYGQESYIKISVRLEKSWDADTEMEAVVAFFPRELNTYSLIIPGSMKLAGSVSPASLDFKIDPVSISQKASVKGLVFKSPVYMRDNLVIPSESSSFYAPVAFGDVVYSGRGVVKAFDPSTGEMDYNPTSFGAPGSRFYSDTSSFGGLLRGFTRDTFDDVGLQHLFNSSGMTDTSYANLMSRCIARKSIVAGLNPIDNTTLQVKESLKTSNALTLRLGLSEKNDFVAYEIPQLGHDGLPIVDAAAGKNYKENFPIPVFVDVAGSSSSSSDAAGVVHEVKYQEQLQLSVDTNAGATNMSLKTNLDAAQGPIGEIPSVVGDAIISLGSNSNLRLPVILAQNPTDTHGQVTIKIDKLRKKIDVATKTTVLDETLVSPCSADSTTSTSTSGATTIVTTVVVDASCAKKTTTVETTTTETPEPVVSGSITFKPEVVSVSGSEFYAGQSFKHSQLVDLKISTSGNLSSLASGFDVSVFPYGLRSKAEFGFSGQLNRVNDTWKASDGSAIPAFKIKLNTASGGLGSNYSSSWQTAEHLSVAPAAVASASLIDENKSPAELDQKCTTTTGAGLGSFGVANYKASFTAQTRHSWYFASVAGESWTEFQAISGLGNLQINGNGGPSPEDGFLIKSIARNCTVQPSAKVVAGFLVCENFKILGRTEPLNFVGTLITKKIEIEPSALNAGVYFQSIFHPDGVALLRNVGILEGSTSSYNCNGRASDPTWNPYPNYTSLSNVFHCSPASLRKNADNFRWTAVDPDCGIVPGGTTTSCKGIKDRFMVKELYRRSKL